MKSELLQVSSSAQSSMSSTRNGSKRGRAPRPAVSEFPPAPTGNPVQDLANAMEAKLATMNRERA